MAVQKQYDDDKKHVHVLSYGGGTQSTAMLLMGLKGEINGVKPDHIIFSDTGNEPKYVMKQIHRVNEYIKKEYGREIHFTDNGNIMQDLIRATETGERVAGLPYHTVNGIGDTGMGRRQCTGDYKIVPVKRKIRELLGYKPRQRVKEMVHMWKGITTDEVQRVKPIDDKWIEAEHPFIWDAPMNRSQCVAYVERELGFTPFSSACVICPFHSNDAWLEIKKNDPEGFDEAVKLDKMLRDPNNKMKFNSQVYLHKSRKPLGEVDLNEDQLNMDDLFEGMCSGFCGL